MSIFEDIIKRMMLACGVEKSTELADFLGKNQSTISRWRDREKVPDGAIAQVAAMTKVNYDWLLTGEGEMRPTKGEAEGDYLDPDLARMVMAEIQGRQGKEPLQLTAGEAAILEMIRDLPEDDRKRVEYEIMTAWVACRRKDK